MKTYTIAILAILALSLQSCDYNKLKGKITDISQSFNPNNDKSDTAVDWTVEIYPVANEGSEGFTAFKQLMEETIEQDEGWHNALYAPGYDNHNAPSYESIVEKASKIPAPEEFRWFYQKQSEGGYAIGLISIKDEFKAHVSKARRTDAPGPAINFNFDGEDAIKGWADITGNHKGESLAIFVNGLYVSAPRVMEEISGGNCSITGDPSAFESLLNVK